MPTLEIIAIASLFALHAALNVWCCWWLWRLYHPQPHSHRREIRANGVATADSGTSRLPRIAGWELARIDPAAGRFSRPAADGR